MNTVTARLATRRALREEIAELEAELADARQALQLERDRATAAARTHLAHVEAQIDAQKQLGAELARMRPNVDALIASNRVMRDAMNYVERIVDDSELDDADARQQAREALYASHFPRRVSL